MITIDNSATKAFAKLDSEVKDVKGSKEKVMCGPVLGALKIFCQQNPHFANAVIGGGSFADCMASVAKSVGNAISDLDAYKKAVQFYFPSAKIEMQLTISLAEHECIDETIGSNSTEMFSLNLLDLI